MIIRKELWRKFVGVVAGILCAIGISSGYAGESVPLSLLSGRNAAPRESLDSRVNVATDGANTAVSIWLKAESGGGDHSIVQVSRSGDAGQTWSTPDVLFAQASDLQALLTASSVYMGNDNWLAMWVVDSVETTNTQIIYTSKSTDNGQSWSAPQMALNKYIAKGFPVSWRLSLASDLSDTIIASFQSQILRSADGGETWTHIPTPETGEYVEVLDEFHTEWDATSRVAYRGNGKWINIYYRRLLVNIDISYKRVYYSLSDDNGLSWSAPEFVMVDGQKLENFDVPYHPPLLGDMATDGANMIIAYCRFKTINFALSDDGGLTWTTSTSTLNFATPLKYKLDISVALNGANAVVVFEHLKEDGSSSLFASYSHNSGNTWATLSMLPVSDGNDAVPSVAPIIGNEFLLNYESLSKAAGNKTVRAIKSLRSTNDGEDWPPPAQTVNPNAFTAAADWQLFQ